MASKRDQIKSEIDQLVSEGKALRDEEASFWKKWAKDETAKRKDRFGDRYHPWYSKALLLVRQLLPERAEEFELYFRDIRQRELDISHYTIQNHISGLILGTHKRNVWARQAITRFDAQISIVESIRDRFDSLLHDIHGTIQAELLDDELDTSRDLLSKKHVRAAGAIAGVVLERHLKVIADARELKVRKNAGLGSINDVLKDGSVYGIPEWRQIQHLADVRNYCVHDHGRDPTQAEVDDLIKQTDRIAKTVF